METQKGVSLMRLFACNSLFVNALLAFSLAHGATTVPMEVKMPGTQPEDNVNLDLVAACDQCHEDSTDGVSILSDWRGSMMSHAGRDPLYWATVAIAEQDFDGAGDLCIRCHTMSGWLSGQSTPTDASTLGDDHALSHVDLYPNGAPDGAITLSDYLLLLEIVLTN